jgi:predicted helicase
MVRSVEDILEKEFGKSLADRGVHILDPFVGTGNFITRVMKEIAAKKKSALPFKYANELHCNEIMLLPYYIASMNIEHEYLDATGEYEPFPGICLVDTFELAEPKQSTLGFMNEENTARVQRQKQSPITVIVGNPPYNMGQENENDNNQNRKYPAVDSRITETYTTDSTATLRNKLSDPYVRAIRWASDRVGDEGVVAYVSNNGFLEGLAFDGLRQHLAKDFGSVYHLNLKGNARTSGERRRREGGNVFDDAIRVGIGITFLVRRHRTTTEAPSIWYSEVPDYWKAEQKKQFLAQCGSRHEIKWERILPDAKSNWIDPDESDGDFPSLIPLGDKAGKRNVQGAPDSVFKLFSLGVVTNRDLHTYNFNDASLRLTVDEFVRIYNDNLGVFRQRRAKNPDTVIDVADPRIKWTRQTKAALERGLESTVRCDHFRKSLYRPFTKESLYFDNFWNEEQYRFREILPETDAEAENVVICATSPGSEKPFMAVASNCIPNLHLVGAGCGTQCFPFYTYDEDGTNRRENITDWALEQFRSHYADPSISKWDIFHYVYAVLHHPAYRERYAANLKRELPRIPFVSADLTVHGAPRSRS